MKLQESFGHVSPTLEMPLVLLKAWGNVCIVVRGLISSDLVLAVT